MIRACFWFDRVFYRHYDEFAATHNALIFRKEEKDALNRHVGPKIFSVRRHLSVVLSSTQDSRLLFNTYLIVVKMVKSANLSQESCRIFIYLFKSQSRNDINFFLLNNIWEIFLTNRFYTTYKIYKNLLQTKISKTRKETNLFDLSLTYHTINKTSKGLFVIISWYPSSISKYI